jgi:hypothetical protein
LRVTRARLCFRGVRGLGRAAMAAIVTKLRKFQWMFGKTNIYRKLTDY